MKNYYWNQGCEFPITKKDVIDGRFYMYAEAIRKLGFLTENPAAGYYKSDEPSVVWDGTAWIPNRLNGELLGTLRVLDGATVRWAVYNETTEAWETDSYPYYSNPLGSGTLTEWASGSDYALDARVSGSNDSPYICILAAGSGNIDPVDDTTNTNWILYVDNTSFVGEFCTIYFARDGLVGKVHRKGTIKLFIDGCVHVDNVDTQRVGLSAGIYLYDEFDETPLSGGWFAPTENYAWIKTPSRNSYYQWDINSFRRVVSGEIEGTWGADTIQEVDYLANQGLPKAFDPYEVTQPRYKIPVTYLDNGTDLLHYVNGETLPIYNKFYEYDNYLWKCIVAEATTSPSIDNIEWEYIDLFATLSLLDFRFDASETEISKHQYYKEDIIGPLFDSQNHIHDTPYWTNTQYTALPSYPPDSTSGDYIYPEDEKMVETTMAYIERLFDHHNFAAEVDTEFKTTFHTRVGGIYPGDGGTAYADYDAAVNGGDADLIVSITHPAWGCNESGFEWALKQCGEFVWYFDTENPYFPDVSKWWSLERDSNNSYLSGTIASIIGAPTNKVAAAVAEFKASFDEYKDGLQGTWRRTWVEALGAPQENYHFRPSTYEPRIFTQALDVAEYANDPADGFLAWDAEVYQDVITIVTSFTWDDNGTPVTETFSGYSKSPAEPVAADDTAVSDTFRADHETDLGNGSTGREWEIDRFVDLLNHIWNVLNVDIGYKSNITISFKESTFTAASSGGPGGNGLKLGDVQALTDNFIRGYKTNTYSSFTNTAYVGYSHDVSQYPYADGVYDAIQTTTMCKATISIADTYNGLPPTAKYKVPLKIWDGGSLELVSPDKEFSSPDYINSIPYDEYLTDNYPNPTLEGGSIVSLGGSDFNVAAGTTPKRWDADPDVYTVKAIAFTPAEANDNSSGYSLTSYWITSGIGIGASNTAWVFISTGGSSYKYWLHHFGDYYGYNKTRGLSFEANQLVVLIEYDWDRVPNKVWYRDGNRPILVDTFELPLLPPYPNPLSWLESPVLNKYAINDYADGLYNSEFSIEMNGFVSNATSIPSGRTVQYIFRLDTLYDLGSADTTAAWDEATTYAINDEVQDAGRLYKALTVNTGKTPAYYATDWQYLGVVMGWSALVKYSTYFEYANESSSWFIKAITEPGADTHFDFVLNDNCFDYLQYCLTYYNLSKWESYAKAYEDDGSGSQLIYDLVDGVRPVCEWSKAEILVTEETGLDMGVEITITKTSTDPDPVVYGVEYAETWDGDWATLETLHDFGTGITFVAKSTTYISDNGETLPTSITASNYADWVGVRVQAITEFIVEIDSNYETAYTAYSGWNLVIPATGLAF